MVTKRKITQIGCSKCDGIMTLVEGDNGPYYKCSNVNSYPPCKYEKSFISINNKKNKIKQIIDFVVDYTGMSLENFLYSRDWQEDVELCLRIFYCETTLEDQKYLRETFLNKYAMDKRNPVDFTFNLLCGWIVEDCIIYYLKSLSWDISLYGCDKGRKFSDNATTVADFQLTLDNGSSILVEEVNDHTGMWKKDSFIALRDYKYPNLVNADAYLLGIDFTTNTFVFLYLPDTVAKRVSNFGVYGKPAYLVKITEDNFYNFYELSMVLSKINI